MSEEVLAKVIPSTTPGISVTPLYSFSPHQIGEAEQQTAEEQSKTQDKALELIKHRSNSIVKQNIKP